MSDVVDFGKSGRSDSYTFTYVNPFTLEETGAAEVEEGSSKLTFDYEGANILSGSITLLNQPSNNQMIRVKRVTTVDGASTFETLGTMFVDWTGEEALNGSVSRSVDCYSTLWRFTQDCLVQDFYRPKGYNVVQEIRELVEADGGRFMVMPGVDTSRTHTMDICFPIETNRAEVLRTIAGWINCEIGVSPDGYITLSPYVEPRLRTVKHDFVDNQNCTYVPGVTVEDDKSGMYNRVVAYYSTKEATDRVMVDLPASHPFSYENIGRRVTYFYKVNDVASREDLTNAANTVLSQHSSSPRYFEIEHVGIPGLTVGDVVTYQNSHDYSEPIFATCQIVQMDMTLGNGCMCKTKLRQID